jgi:ribose/xylose/arabinose/galactoside ABC-type transport system permease subunit
MTAVASRPARGARRARAARFLNDYGQEVVVLLATIFIFVVVGTLHPRFLSGNNLLTIFSGNAYVAVAALGMSLVIISGHIDVSVGALIGVLATVAGTLITQHYPVWVAWGVPVLVGIAVEALIGVLVAYARIPSIVVTLGMLSILRGGLITVTGGAWISGLPANFLIAQWRVFGIQAPIVAMVILTILMAIWMRSTSTGRSIYAIGGNAEAARTTGIPIQRTTVLVFAIHGFFAGIAALLFATQLQVIQSTVPSNLELTVITASVIGGVSILGGTGTVIGSTLATILFASIGSALIFIGVSAYWLRAVLGLLILVTVLADMARRNRAL